MFLAISKVAPSVRKTYIEHQLNLWSTYYFPCFGRSGKLYIYPNRKSWFKDEKSLDVSSGRFRLGPVQYEDAGIYKCMLENSVSSVTITFNITIVGKGCLVLFYFDTCILYSALIKPHFPSLSSYSSV